MKTWCFLTFVEIAITRSKEHRKAPVSLSDLNRVQWHDQNCFRNTATQVNNYLNNKPSEENPPLLKQAGVKPKTSIMATKQSTYLSFFLKSDKINKDFQHFTLFPHFAPSWNIKVKLFKIAGEQIWCVWLPRPGLIPTLEPLSINADAHSPEVGTQALKIPAQALQFKSCCWLTR